MIPEFFVLVSFFYHFGWVANLIIKRAKDKLRRKRREIEIDMTIMSMVANSMPVISGYQLDSSKAEP